MSTKTDLIDKIAEKTEFTKKDAEKAVNACLESMEESLTNGGSLRLTGFGSLSVVERKERKGRNPQTGKEMIIPASRTIKFSPGKGLKEKVN